MTKTGEVASGKNVFGGTETFMVSMQVVGDPLGASYMALDATSPERLKPVYFPLFSGQ